MPEADLPPLVVGPFIGMDTRHKGEDDDLSCGKLCRHGWT
jgi:hypothetical protein